MTRHFCSRLFWAVLIPLTANLLLVNLWMSAGILMPGKASAGPAARILFTVLVLSCWFGFQIRPFCDKERSGRRLRIMMGGRTLCYAALWGFAAQAVILLAAGRAIIFAGIPVSLLVLNVFLALAVNVLMLWNGILRIFFTSTRLRLRIRLLMLLAMWIPAVNLFVLLYALRLVHAEYDFACYKESLRAMRAESDMCKTKYPLILVHGIGFRDLRYFNYWGRIPRELTRYGAVVFYGNQEALGTIAYNAEDIRKKILEIVQETGCEKVNIIAHSKGGLDSRYAVSRLGMDKYTASLTTICTPHRGCRFVDYACRLPEGLYRFVARWFDRAFARFGDRNPDFYTATHQFSTESSRQFNEEVPDCPGVYYQSYASRMRGRFSDPLLSLPYSLIRPLEGENDGLVSTSSAQWGEFRKVFSNQYYRGISHGDMIDLKREDYRGFDVVECYVKMVAELAAKGF